MIRGIKNDSVDLLRSLRGSLSNPNERSTTRANRAMAWFSSKNRYAKRYSGWRYSKQRRISRGNRRAAAQQRDSLSLTLKYSDTITITSDGTTQPPAFRENIYNAVRKSPMYAAFASMYDQFKINSATVHVTQKSANSAVQTPAAPLLIATAWDRSGIEYNPTAEALRVETYTDTAQRSSAYSKSALYGSSFKTTRSLYPSTIEEKGQYISTAKLALAEDEDVDNSNVNIPYSLIESGSYKFKPTFILAVETVAAAANATQIATFDVDYEIVLTFRGLRKIPVA